MTDDERQPVERTRRRWPWYVGGLAVVIAGATIATLVASSEPEADVAESAGTFNTSEVLRTDLVAQESYEGTLGTIEDDPLTAPAAGVVSFAPQAGDTVGFG